MDNTFIVRLHMYCIFVELLRSIVQMLNTNNKPYNNWLSVNGITDNPFSVRLSAKCWYVIYILRKLNVTT